MHISIKKMVKRVDLPVFWSHTPGSECSQASSCGSVVLRCGSYYVAWHHGWTPAAPRSVCAFSPTFGSRSVEDLWFDLQGKAALPAKKMETRTDYCLGLFWIFLRKTETKVLISLYWNQSISIQTLSLILSRLPVFWIDLHTTSRFHSPQQEWDLHKFFVSIQYLHYYALRKNESVRWTRSLELIHAQHWHSRRQNLVTAGHVLCFYALLALHALNVSPSALELIRYSRLSLQDDSSHFSHNWLLFTSLQKPD